MKILLSLSQVLVWWGWWVYELKVARVAMSSYLSGLCRRQVLLILHWAYGLTSPSSGENLQSDAQKARSSGSVAELGSLILPCQDASMKLDTRENKFVRRWLPYCLGMLLLVISLILFLSSGTKSKAQSIVVLATWSSNGEQVVSFRLEPSNSEVTCAELVSDSYDGSAQPPTSRTPWGELMPVSFSSVTNPIRYDALPIPGASIMGRPVAYTPGSYTVAYVPTGSANRLRAGVALERKGIEDWLRRCQKSWERKSLVMLRFKTHQDPVFVTSETITNVTSVAR